MKAAPVWACERSVDVDVPAAFAWRYMTDVRNWNDPPAEFDLDGPFANGARGTTRMPDRPPASWTIAEVDRGSGYTIVGDGFLENASLSVRWRFEPVSDTRTRLTQRLELSGANAPAHVEAIRSAFEPNLEPGMRRIANLMVGAMASASMPVVVVLDNVRSLYNTGAFFRTADACAIERLVLCGITPRPDQGRKQQRAIAKTALGAELTVRWEYQADTSAALAAHAAAGYHIVAVETAPDATDLYDWTPTWPLCLVFGHEREGVTASVAAQIEAQVRIPMLGGKRSLNVATAGGVVLYELLRRRRYAGVAGGG